jgi:hypothetical protein
VVRLALSSKLLGVERDEGVAGCWVDLIEVAGGQLALGRGAFGHDHKVA